MAKGSTSSSVNPIEQQGFAPKLPLKRRFPNGLRYWDLYLIMVPGLLFFLIFKYLPMWGTIISFQDYNPFSGIWGSPWVGWAHFERMFNSPEFYQVFVNTLLISLYKLVWGFPAPIVLALMLNEVRNMMFKKSIQTIVYLPHFLSWVIVGGILFNILSPSTGIVNEFVQLLGFKPIMFLGSEEWFRSILVISDIWKTAGWGTIIYLAALAGINPELYEAATVDGASRWKQLWHITLPSLMPTISILFLLNLSSVLDVGFEQILILYNPLVYSVGDVIETYVYRVGISQGEFSYTTAVGLFKSVIALVLVSFANWFSKKVGQEGLW
jgi:putative aldouronate transport system permease protein